MGLKGHAPALWGALILAGIVAHYTLLRAGGHGAAAMALVCTFIPSLGFAYLVAFLFRKLPFGSDACASVELIAAIYSTPVEEARNRARRILQDSKEFECVKVCRAIPSDWPPLGPHLKDFFKEYETVLCPQAGMDLAWRHVGGSDYERGYVRIGLDEMHIEYVVRPGEDEIGTLEGPRKATEQKPTYIPSVWHLICEVHDSLFG